MTTENGVKPLGSLEALLAAETLTSKENYLANWTGSSGLALTDSRYEKPGYIVVSGAASGSRADVRPWIAGGIYRVRCSAAVTDGDRLQVDTSNDGQLVTQTTGPCVAIARETIATAGIATVQAFDQPEHLTANAPFGMPAPGTLNATGTLTAALIATGYVTSSTAAAVTMTTDTGTDLDTGLPHLATGQAIEFTLCNTGGSNAITLAGGTGVTIVSGTSIAAGKAASYWLKKTGTATYSVYPK